MRFKLTQRTATKFRVEDERGDIIGLVSLASPQEVPDLLRCWSLRCWSGAVDRNQSQAPVAALKSRPLGSGMRMSKEAVLRGC